MASSVVKSEVETKRRCCARAVVYSWPRRRRAGRVEERPRHWCRSGGESARRRRCSELGDEAERSLPDQKSAQRRNRRIALSSGGDERLATAMAPSAAPRPHWAVVCALVAAVPAVRVDDTGPASALLQSHGSHFPASVTATTRCSASRGLVANSTRDLIGFALVFTNDGNAVPALSAPRTDATAWKPCGRDLHQEVLAAATTCAGFRLLQLKAGEFRRAWPAEEVHQQPTCN